MKYRQNVFIDQPYYLSVFIYTLNSNVTNAKLSILDVDLKASQPGITSERCLVSSVVCYFNDE